ncbi:methyltransferase [Methanobacterium sp. CWC-01]|uniref:HemK2/MTQ2 family protein methyltransferase n=1 Tax=Methanobacterium aridiramus TaxID=2584467 RepID=UPI0025790893|nr:HemK2/MTQ2 family protein methyltransferase [Methanobacterium sp. CWC-01]WJI09582.1 methyltransferase [Methanobacterium sp. CWC-01]
MLEYNGLFINTHPQVYEPAEDSLLLANTLELSRKDVVLEIGTGTGIIAISAARKVARVVATDINPWAIHCASKNLIANRAFNVELREGNLFEPVQGEKFDLIVFNTPYLPTEEDEMLDDDLNSAWDGGINGREIIDKFLDGLRGHIREGGRVQLVQSSLSDVDRTLERLEQIGFQASVIAVEKCFFEEIVVISGKLGP